MNLDSFKQLVVANPFIDYLGIELTELRPGYASGELKVTNHHQNLINSIHGGCLYTLADIVACTAASSRGQLVTTLSVDFHYLRPGIGTTRLYAKATEIKDGKRIMVYNCSVYDQYDVELAYGTFTLSKTKETIEFFEDETEE